MVTENLKIVTHNSLEISPKYLSHLSRLSHLSHII